MAFLFNFLVLAIISFVLIAVYADTKSETPLKILLGMWIAAFAFLVLGLSLEYYNRPTPLQKSDVIGTYQIDRKFYPGPNAEWQYAHFAFSILPSDSIIFVEANENGTSQKIYQHQLQWVQGIKATWRVIADSTSHVLENPPTLYRHRHHFYYVLNSRKFGKMFFRKADNL